MTVRRSPLVAGSGDSDMAAFAMPYTVFLILGSEDCCATALAAQWIRDPSSVSAWRWTISRPMRSE